MLQLLPLTKWFSIQMSIIHDNISSQVTDKRKQGFDQWMNSSIIHNYISSLIHNKCHMKSYHSDIKYHMTLNIIIIVVDIRTLLATCTTGAITKYFYKQYSNVHK